MAAIATRVRPGPTDHGRTMTLDELWIDADEEVEQESAEPEAGSP